MSEVLYSRDILRLAVSIPNEKRLIDADGTAECQSKTCGSRVAVDVLIADNGTINELGIEVNACALGQASAAILSREAIGKTRKQIEEARTQLQLFLTGSSPNIGTWEKMELLEPVIDHKGRHGAVLLPYDAILEAFTDAQSKTGVV